MTEPRRDLTLDLEDDVPGGGPAFKLTPDAPYGYKKDGTPAAKRGRKPGSSSTPSKGPRGPRTASLEKQIGGAIFFANMFVSIVSTKDALDPVEIEALAKAIDDECQRNARFKKYVESALAVQGGTNLALVVVMIIGRRAIRHNLVPIPQPIGNEGADAAIGQLLSISTGKGAFNPNLFVMPDEAAK